MEFMKCEGLGNDFVVVDALDAPCEMDTALARRLCDRRRGIGADGVLLITAGRAAPFAMTVFNADGSRPEVCGNGLRCVARYLRDFRADVPPRFTIETDAGPREVEDHGAEISVQMGPARDGGVHTARWAGGAATGRRIDVGNPHFVLFGDFGEADARRDGPDLERHADFPGGVNVSFATQEAPDRFRLFVWERGCGLTSACGTGACATAAAAWLEDRAAPTATLQLVLPGGSLFIAEGAAGLVMRGPARVVFSGVWRRDSAPSLRGGGLRGGGLGGGP